MMQTQYQVPPWMFGAVQNVESSGNPNAVSPAGAVGSMQTMPSTLRDPGFGVMPARDNSPQEMQRVGQDYLQAMFNRYQGNPEHALMAYNWGPGHVDKLLAGQIPQNQVPVETQNYVPKVMEQKPSQLGEGTQYAQNDAIQSDAAPQVNEQELLLKARARLRLQQKQQPQAQAPISQTEDAIKSFGGGLERGAAGMAMFLPNLLNQAAEGPQLLGRGIAEGADSLLGIDPQPRGNLWHPFVSSDEALQQLPEAIQPHTPQTPIGVGADILGQFGGNILAGKGIQGIDNIPANTSTSFLKNNASVPARETPSAPEIRDMASDKFAEAEQKGGMLMSHITDKWINDASSSLPQTSAGKLVLGDTPSTQLIDRLQGLKGQPLTLKAAQEIDSALGDMAESHVDPKTGKLLAEGNKFKEIQQSLRDHIENANANDIVGGKEGFDAMKQARDLWAAQARANDVQRILARAQNAEVPATVIKNGFNALANNPSRMRGFLPEEQDAIRQAAKTGIVVGSLKTLGSKLMSGMAGAAGGGALGVPIGMAAGYPLRAMANSLQYGKGQNVLDMIGNRPAVQSAMGYTPMQPAQPQPSMMIPFGIGAGMDELMRGQK